MTEELADSLVVWYASQTGNAEWIAKHVHEEAIHRGFNSTCIVLDDYAKVDFSKNLAFVFITSTTGDGDPPDNATKFWRWMRRAKKPELEGFANKKFTILGLGDTNYSNFCQPAKRLDRKLLELGSISFLPKGLADDGTGLEQVVDPWVEKLWQALLTVVKQDQAKAAARAASTTGSGSLSELLSKNKKKDGDDSKDGKTDNNTTGNSSATAMQVDAPGSVVKDVLEAAASPAAALTGLSILEAKLAKLVIPTHHQPFALRFPAQTKSTTPNANTKPAAGSFITVTDTSARRSIAESGTSLFHLIPSSSNNYTITDSSVYTPNNPFASRITAARVLTGSRAVKKIIEVTLDTTHMHWNAQAGDVLGVLAPNPDELVLPLLKRCGIDAEAVVDIKADGDGTGLPLPPLLPITAYEVLRYFLDLRPPPRKPLLQLLLSNAQPGSPDAGILSHLLASPANLKPLRELKPTLADLLATFSSVKSLSLAELLEVLPRLQGRWFSVARRLPGTAGVTVAFNVVEYINSQGHPVVGQCTPWLDQIASTLMSSSNRSNGNTVPVPVYIRPVQSFQPPPDLSVPMIMVAAGTGITPFISFLEGRERGERGGAAEKQGSTGSLDDVALMAASESVPTTLVGDTMDTFDGSVVCGETWLFHGRRFIGEDGDKVYAAELDEFKRKRVLTRFVECVSRDDVQGEGPIGPEYDIVVKGYVQAGLLKYGPDIWRLLSSGNASFFVCGSIEMSKSVHEALVQIIGAHGGITGPAEVKAFFARLVSKKRYLKDIWG